MEKFVVYCENGAQGGKYYNNYFDAYRVAMNLTHVSGWKWRVRAVYSTKRA